MQALCTLDCLGALDEKALLIGLKDKHPGVRRHALRLSETWFARSAAIASAALALMNDDDAQVRLQLAYSLGEWTDERAGKALGTLAVADASNPYIIAAVLSSTAREQLPGVVASVLDATQDKEHPV